MTTAKQMIQQTPGLVGFWDFDGTDEQALVSRSPGPGHRLEAVGGPIRRVHGGPISGWAVELNGSRYFRIPHDRAGELDIGGAEAQVSMFAVINLRSFGSGVTVAGKWYEGAGENDDSGTRQYALLLNMPTYGGTEQVTPHVSSEGGLTRRADGSALPWCADYAASVSRVPLNQWCSVGFTYDGQYLKAFFNGVCERRELDPRADKRDDPYFTREGPNGTDRGMNPYYHGRGIFRYDPRHHAASKPAGPADFTIGARYAVGSMLGEAFYGRLGGLAVFNQAVTEQQMLAMHQACHWTPPVVAITTSRAPQQAVLGVMANDQVSEQ
jgi:hypothetical protein